MGVWWLGEMPREGGDLFAGGESRALDSRDLGGGTVMVATRGSGVSLRTAGAGTAGGVWWLGEDSREFARRYLFGGGGRRAGKVRLLNDGPDSFATDALRALTCDCTRDVGGGGAFCAATRGDEAGLGGNS